MSRIGDIGYLNEEGYLFLTDRQAFVIISGGVNIYPQEIENLLITHPDVMDAAVFGVPDEDFGEAVKAVIRPSIQPAGPPNWDNGFADSASGTWRSSSAPSRSTSSRRCPGCPPGSSTNAHCAISIGRKPRVRRTLYAEKHEAFRKAFRAFIDHSAVPHVEAWEDAETVDRQFIRAAGENGFLGFEFGAEFGGTWASRTSATTR